MSKDLEQSVLLDFYGQLLTDKQRNLMQLYYNEDLSLGEISELSDITRQGVQDSIRRSSQQLSQLEQKLGMVARDRRHQQRYQTAQEIAMQMALISKKFGAVKLQELTLQLDELANSGLAE